METKSETAIFGGGCFWCTEAIFYKLKGVNSVSSGYAGGKTANPTYEQVSSEVTGHAEVVKIDFDPNTITYSQLLEVFFATHDPTLLNKQGADIGSQYRSIILYTNNDQKLLAETEKGDQQKYYGNAKKVFTEIVELDKFYDAESYHKQYYEKNEDKPYCQIVISPKIKKLLEKFSYLIKS